MPAIRCTLMNRSFSGDYLMPKQTGFVVLDTADVVFGKYVAAHSPLSADLAGRITAISPHARRRWWPDTR